MYYTKILYLGLLLFSSFVFYSCDDDNTSDVPKAVQDINAFVHQNMNTYYYWEAEMPNINYRFEPNTFDYFEKLRHTPDDRWSFITDDHQGLKDMLSGIHKSTGYEFSLFYRDEKTSNDVVGFIAYVEPNSPADYAGLKRGDMFYKIDNIKLNDSNYMDYVFREAFKLTLGTLNTDLSVTERSPSVNIMAVELQSNPILVSKVIDYAGSKIGYLAYTSFLDDFNDQLEAEFAKFKSAGVNGLVLDLRYNSGGAVSSALLLCNMIAPAHTIGEVLLHNTFNTQLTKALKEEWGEGFNVDHIQANANNLNLDELVVLTGRNTASASEMIIYGLQPHMNVYQIGEATHGKYYASITLSDPDNNHNWAIQPIVMRAENKDNSIDYSSGLEPDVARVDFIGAFNSADIYPLGDINEDYLALAIEHITGQSPLPSGLKSSTLKTLRPLSIHNKHLHPLHYDMQYNLKK